MGEVKANPNTGSEIACKQLSTPIQMEITKAQQAIRPAAAKEIRHAMAPLIAANLQNPPPDWGLAQPIYVEVLKEIPIDLIQDAVMAHIRQSVWFPRPAELLTLCNERLAHRHWRLRALHEQIEPSSPPPPTPSAAAKAAVDTLMASHFPGDRAPTTRERPSPEEVHGAVKRAADGLRFFRMPEDDDPVVQEWLRKASAS